ncbi:MAG: GH92 family glycosyl hydrolase, partial [Bacteroidaceae bacterium]|nr:GH92 family glycosyl hydrolase [Bacteroidaceae bacterium]
REAQQYEGGEVNYSDDGAISGWQRISGGWNNGAPYTVYFYAEKQESMPLDKDKATLSSLSLLGGEYESFVADISKVVDVKIGISFVSVDKAKQNLREDIPHWDFSVTYNECIDKWNRILAKVELAPETSKEYKRMFYTALYHTMLMPVDRTKDNGLYDDYYAIWDTYRTSTPLITLLDPQRATAIAKSLLDIYKLTGYMPDARSGNSNGRTQGGSNAEIVIADALAKGLNLDYELALKAMLKDATVAPKDDEAEGRGGLDEYNSLGYVPYGVARGGNRTVEYAFCDWAIAQVAKHFGKDDLYSRYMAQSGRWKNLWRNDYVHDGAKGFIMPRDKNGAWLDSVPYGHSKIQTRKFLYTPDISYEGPWYCAWWDCFFYEASSWEYSFSIPHDIPALIQASGGREAFERRLDTFFAHKYYNVANEPSFLTPCLYHWVGRPDKSSFRVENIIRDSFNDSESGLPGNDDGGAMSSWLAFHMLGLYPNAGHDYYLVHKPLLKSASISLENGNVLDIRSCEGNFSRAFFNGQELKDNRITHGQLMQGGVLEIETPKSYRFIYKLHGQTRRFDVTFSDLQDGRLVMRWGIMRNMKYWQGTFIMNTFDREHSGEISYIQPTDGLNMELDGELFALVSREVLRSIRKEGSCVISNTSYRLIEKKNNAFHLMDDLEGAYIWILDDENLPLIVRMKNNPVEINWYIEGLAPAI